MNLEGFLSITKAALTVLPTGIELFEKVEALFSTADPATIDTALAAANAAADNAYQDSQKL